LALRARPGHKTNSGAHSSEALLQAVTSCIGEILSADSLREALPHALLSMGRTVRIDRLVIIEKPSGGDNTKLTPQIFFIWNSEDSPNVDVGAVIEKSRAREAMEEWLRPLRQGETVSIVRRLVTGTMHDLVTELQIVSTLLVPMMLDGSYCGELIFDDCRGEHEWTAVQINILKLLADFIGMVVMRERVREELR